MNCDRPRDNCLQALLFYLGNLRDPLLAHAGGIRAGQAGRWGEVPLRTPQSMRLITGVGGWEMLNTRRCRGCENRCWWLPIPCDLPSKTHSSARSVPTPSPTTSPTPTSSVLPRPVYLQLGPYLLGPGRRFLSAASLHPQKVYIDTEYIYVFWVIVLPQKFHPQTE